MLGSMSTEIEVKVAASEAWKVYGTLLLHNVIQNGLPQVLDKIDIVEGDGGVGTIIHISFHPEMGGTLKPYKEKFTVVDNERRVKVAEAVEGGYLDLGFNLYRTRVEVIEKEEKEKEECITRITVEYQLKHEAAANVALVSIQPFTVFLQVIADYLHKNNTNSL